MAPESAALTNVAAVVSCMALTTATVTLAVPANVFLAISCSIVDTADEH